MIIILLTEEFENGFTCLIKNTEKNTTFSVPIQKVVIGIKIENKVQKWYLTDYNLLIA